MDDTNSKQLRSIKNILSILLVIVVFAVLRELSSLLLPLALAGLLTILSLPMVNFLAKKKVPKVLVTILVAFVTILVLWIVLSMISGTIDQLIQDKDFLASQFTKKVDASIVQIGHLIPFLDVEMMRGQISNVLAPANIAGLIGNVLGALGDFGSSTVVFLIYYLILLSGATGYQAYVSYVAGSDQNSGTTGLWSETQKSISVYMGIKTAISLVTGISAGLICWIFGLQFALFWGFMAFVLNYIPSIGSMLATVLPIFMAIIQYDQFGIILALAIILGVSQFVIGSVIDPMIMGSRLRLNTVAVIFGLMFWGYIWGIPGMLLSVPLMVVIRLILERSEDLSIIARVMGVAEKPGRSKPSLMTRILNRGRTSEPEKTKKDN